MEDERNVLFIRCATNTADEIFSRETHHLNYEPIASSMILIQLHGKSFPPELSLDVIVLCGIDFLFFLYISNNV